MFHPNPISEVTVHDGAVDRDNLSLRFMFASVCDFSGSMAEHRHRLPQAWKRMVAQLDQQTEARQRALLACCAFDHRVMFQDYAPLAFYRDAELEFPGGGQTHLATALVTTVERTRACRKQLAAAGVPCLRSLVAVISDGGATDRDRLDEAVRLVADAERQGEIDFVPIAPSVDDVQILWELFRKEPILLAQLDYETLFRGFAKSISVYSRSMCGFEPDGRALLAKHVDDTGRNPLLAGPHDR